MSRCSRFLTALRSGTTWNQIRGPRPPGSTMQSAPAPSSSSGTPTSRQYASQLAKPSGGGSRSYPSAAAQKRASGSGSAQSITSWKLTAIGLSPGAGNVTPPACQEPRTTARGRKVRVCGSWFGLFLAGGQAEEGPGYAHRAVRSVHCIRFAAAMRSSREPRSAAHRSFVSRNSTCSL